MAEETNNVVPKNEAAAETAKGFSLSAKGYDADGGIDVANLPPLPWTRDALGEEYFDALALAAGVGSLKNQRNPSIDPRSFFFSRAKKLIRENQLRGEEAKAILDEGAAAQKAFDEQLPKPGGLARSPKAPALKPARTTFKESGRRPAV